MFSSSPRETMAKFRKPFRVAAIAHNGPGIIIDDFAVSDAVLDGSILATDEEKEYVTPIWIIFFDSAGRAGDSVIGNEAQVKGVGGPTWEI
jgi:hypothetical protein